MNPHTRQVKLLLTYLLLFTFSVCGLGGLFCAMPASATDAHHSQSTSHHPSSQDGECPDQFKNAKKQSERFSVVLVQVENLENLGMGIDSFQSRISKHFFKEGTIIPSTYPPPFLLFSVLLN